MTRGLKKWSLCSGRSRGLGEQVAKPALELWDGVRHEFFKGRTQAQARTLQRSDDPGLARCGRSTSGVRLWFWRASGETGSSVTEFAACFLREWRGGKQYSHKRIIIPREAKTRDLGVVA